MNVTRKHFALAAAAITGLALLLSIEPAFAGSLDLGAAPLAIGGKKTIAVVVVILVLAVGGGGYWYSQKDR